MTGFPRTRADFEWLDNTEMAPNRYYIKLSNYLNDKINSVSNCWTSKKKKKKMIIWVDISLTCFGKRSFKVNRDLISMGLFVLFIS